MKNIIILLIINMLIISSCSKHLANKKSYDSNSNSVVLPNTQVTSGIDISRWQGRLIDQIDASDSLSFIICKVTQGTTITDKQFEYNWQAIKKLRIPRGGYHFYVTTSTPNDQVEYYIKNVDWKSADIPPILDIESGSIRTDITTRALQNDLAVFLKLIEVKTNRKPIIYTNLYFANKYLNHSFFSKYSLWIADYSSAAEPRLPLIWADKGWVLWQKSESFVLKSHEVDLNIFNGSSKDLKNFIKQSKL